MDVLNLSSIVVIALVLPALLLYCVLFVGHQIGWIQSRMAETVNRAIHEANVVEYFKGQFAERDESCEKALTRLSRMGNQFKKLTVAAILLLSVAAFGQSFRMVVGSADIFPLTAEIDKLFSNRYEIEHLVIAGALIGSIIYVFFGRRELGARQLILVSLYIVIVPLLSRLVARGTTVEDAFAYMIPIALGMAPCGFILAGENVLSRLWPSIWLRRNRPFGDRDPAITHEDKLRLVKQGYRSFIALAGANLVRLYFKTRIDLRDLACWIDQASLEKRFDGNRMILDELKAQSIFGLSDVQRRLEHGTVREINLLKHTTGLRGTALADIKDDQSVRFLGFLQHPIYPSNAGLTETDDTGSGKTLARKIRKFVRKYILFDMAG